jgi:hypothetical protein
MLASAGWLVATNKQKNRDDSGYNNSRHEKTSSHDPVSYLHRAAASSCATRFSTRISILASETQ